jgi:hypothetical protein
MKFLSPYRLASYVLVLFCAGHTGGGMLAQKSLGPESDGVFNAMKTVHVNFNGADCTWYGFWFAFGLTVSAFLLLGAITAWQLDKVPPESWGVVSVIAWALVVSLAFNTVLSWKYFFTGPGLFSTAATVLLAIGAWRKETLARAKPVERMARYAKVLPGTDLNRGPGG